MLTEGPLLDGHDYEHRDYVECFFDVPVDYANARRPTDRRVRAFAAVDARRVGAALAALVANGRGTSDERMERSSCIYV